MNKKERIQQRIANLKLEIGGLEQELKEEELKEEEKFNVNKLDRRTSFTVDNGVMTSYIGICHDIRTMRGDVSVYVMSEINKSLKDYNCVLAFDKKNCLVTLIHKELEVFPVLF